MSEQLSWFRWLRTFPIPALMVFALLWSGCEKIPQGVKQGKQAPAISGVDVTGKTIKLSDYKGKVVLLDFWATWCGPCVASIPKELQMMRIYGKRPFTILGICNDGPEALQKFFARESLPWPNIMDRSGSIGNAWGIENIPTWVLIDDEGVIQGRWSGGGEVAKVDEAVEHAVKIAETR